MSKFSRMVKLEKLQLRSVNGLTMAEGSSRSTDVEGLVDLKTLVSPQPALVIAIPLNPGIRD